MLKRSQEIMLKVIAIFLLSLLLTSCIATLSSKPEYADLINSEVRTKRKSILSKVSRKEIWSSATHKLISPAPDHVPGKEVVWLEPGTPLRITKVNRYYTHTGGAWIGATGLVKDPVSGKSVKFLYDWSSFAGREPAPWEDESVSD